MISRYNKVVILFGLLLLLALSAMIADNSYLLILAILLFIIMAPTYSREKMKKYREYGENAGKFYRIFIKKDSEGKLMDRVESSVEQKGDDEAKPDGGAA